MEIASTMSYKRLTDALANFCKTKQRHEVLALVSEAAEQASKEMSFETGKGYHDFSRRVANLAFAEQSDERRESKPVVLPVSKVDDDELPTLVYLPKATKTFFEEIIPLEDIDIDTTPYPIMVG